MAPKEVDFYLRTVGEVTYPPRVGRRVVYMLFAKVVCPGGHLRRQEEGDFEGEQRGWVTHILLTLGADCV